MIVHTKDSLVISCLVCKNGCVMLFCSTGEALLRENDPDPVKWFRCKKNNYSSKTESVTV